MTLADKIKWQPVRGYEYQLFLPLLMHMGWTLNNINYLLKCTILYVVHVLIITTAIIMRFSIETCVPVSIIRTEACMGMLLTNI